MNEKTKRIIFKALFFLIIAVMLCVSAFPYYWTIVSSFKNETELFAKPLQYLVKNPTLENYQAILSTDFMLGIYNSFVVAMITTALSLAVSTVAAYAFSRYRFPGREVLRSTFIVIYMIPPVLILIPMFQIFSNMGLINTHWALIIAYLSYTVPYALWLLIGFLNDLPVTLEEASMIDGTTRIGAFFRIILPLVAPGMVASGIYCFIYAWNEFIYALIFTNREAATLPVVLNSFVGQNIIQWGALTAGGVLAGLPVAILFSIVQRQLVQGLTAGAVKG